jgi:mRNA interferase RelE/StbE
MPYHVLIRRRAEKELARLDAKTQSLLAHWILNNLEGCEDPKAVGNGRKLESVKSGWRWRVGTYRILATIDEHTVSIEIFRIGHRSKVYRKLQGRA